MSVKTPEIRDRITDRREVRTHKIRNERVQNSEGAKEGRGKTNELSSINQAQTKFWTKTPITLGGHGV